MGATALAVNNLDVSSADAINGNDGLGDGKNTDGSLGTLGKIDAAIAKVSDQRSTLGAYQNRLEHTISQPRRGPGEPDRFREPHPRRRHGG